ncbi:GNAT family N-acetyltransferase [Desertihabitans brevis]|nr:GNAT family N-acetyltransferase [Desertihabitans brevis]
MPEHRVDELRTPRLRMHRWGPRERDALAALNADPEVMRFFPGTQDRARTDALVDRVEACFEERGWGLWAVTPDATGEPVGFVGLHPLPAGVPGAEAGGVEVGWRLARHAWGHGYATEAATAAVTVAFDIVGLPDVWSMTAELNTPSQAVMRRLGLTLHSRFEHPAVPEGSPLRAHVMYRTTAGRWAQRRSEADEAAVGSR